MKKDPARIKRHEEFINQILPILKDEYNVREPAKGTYCISPAGKYESITFYPMADKIHVPEENKWMNEGGLQWIFDNLIPL